MPELAYVNGRYGSISEATVPIDDRGYQFGDGVYEVISAIGGKPFLLEGHLRRLKRSLDGLRIESVDFHEIENIVRSLSERVGVPRAKVYISISRGVAPRNHIFPKGVKPNVIATARPVTPPPAEYLTSGIKAIVRQDIRWQRCDLKTLNLLGNVLLRQEAEDAGAQEVILCGPDGLVREGSSSNVFVVKSGQVFTHPCDHYILPGITRELVLDLAKQAGIEIKEIAVKEEVLRQADEIFLTGTIAELVAVTTLDGSPVSNGSSGPLTKAIRNIYDIYINEFSANS